MLDEVALSTHLFVNETLTLEHLQSIRETGFRSIELWAMPHHVDYRSGGAWRKVVDATASAGLGICTVHAPFYRTVAEARLGRFLSICAEREAERHAAIDEISLVLDRMPLPTTDLLVVHPGSPRDFLDRKAIDRLRAALEKVLALAEGRGVRIALENMPFPGAGCKEVLDLISSTSAFHLGLTFDLGHANVLATPQDLMAECLSRAWVIHAHDNKGDSDSHLLPFDGTIDWRAVAASMRRSRPQAPLVLELRCDARAYATSMREALARTTRLFQDGE